MNEFNIPLRTIQRKLNDRLTGMGRRANISTLRGMCTGGVLAKYAVKNGNAWEIPGYVAADFIDNYVPYGSPAWSPSVGTVREFNRRRKVAETQTAQPTESVAP